MSGTVVLLHGFASTRRSWDRVAALLERGGYRPLALDIRGHGAASAARPVSFDACAADIAAVAPDRFTLCGYSLGARVALHAALMLGERVRRLVLVSGSAGIEDPQERARRREDDERLARLLETDGIEALAARWRELPLFAADPQWVRDEVEAEQRRNDPRGLAAALRGLGAGAMEPLWGRLGELEMPRAVLAGERDVRYRELARRLAGEGEAAVVVPGAGHRLALEAPEAVAVACEGTAR